MLSNSGEVKPRFFPAPWLKRLAPVCALVGCLTLAGCADSPSEATAPSAGDEVPSGPVSGTVIERVEPTQPSHTEPVLADDARTLIVLGDSISAAYGIQREQGWVALMQQELLANEFNWRAINASISGDTTGGGLARLPGLLETYNPDLVIIELGGNDGLRGYPVEQIEANLTRMVELVTDNGGQPALVSMRIPPNYGPRYTTAFDGVFAKVAQATDTPLLPFIMENVALVEGMMQADGIHPTADAQPVLLEALWPGVEALLAGME